MLLNSQKIYTLEKRLFNLLSYFKKKYNQRSSHTEYKGYQIRYFYIITLILVQKDNLIMRFDVSAKTVTFRDLSDLLIAKISILEDSCTPVYTRKGYSLPTEFIEGLYDIIDIYKESPTGSHY